MAQTDQILLFSDDELSLLKNTFADNDSLLYAFRSLLFQFELSKEQLGMLRQALTPELIEVLSKRILPRMAPERPIGQMNTLLSFLGDQIKAKDAAEMAPQIEAVKLEIDYLQQQIDAMESVDDYAADIELQQLADLEGKTDEERFIGLTAYLFLMAYIEQVVLMIKSLAGEKKETLEQQKGRLIRNSSK